MEVGKSGREEREREREMNAEEKGGEAKFKRKWETSEGRLEHLYIPVFNSN